MNEFRQLMESLEALEEEQKKTPFNFEELQSFYQNAGYDPNEFKDIDQITYSGYDRNRHQHTYVCSIEDDGSAGQEPGSYYVTFLHVYLGQNGLHAEWPGVIHSEHENLSQEEAHQLVAKLAKEGSQG